MDEIDRWSNIHRDILKEIAKHFYSYDDFIQLQLVCKQWSLKLPEISNEILWLLIPDEESSSTHHIYEDEEIYHLMQLPIADEVTVEIQGLEEQGIPHLMLRDMHDNVICGSYNEWLIIMSITEGSMYMLNAFTKVHLDLPQISTNTDLVWKVIINSCPDSDDKDFMAVAIYGPRYRLAFYRPNNKRWLKIKFSTRRPSYFRDVIFFEEKIYAINSDGQPYKFDTKTNSRPVGGIHEAKPPSDVDAGSYKFRYLMGCSNGSLLMLVRYFSREMLHTCNFDIYELKKNAKEWHRIQSLGNYVLMIGPSFSVQMLPARLFQGKGNRIYFTDYYLEFKWNDYVDTHDIGIFDLNNGSCQRLLSDVNFVSTPVWCYPNSVL
ncbi:hypothetical protein PIB30_001552 [Stylosanthes scabra]|uniref:KIB1-4 beta-propeller domain-containing protein n=1 Tax=Stylosanthes scabra TaxID=79078 RepID=A0ABU6R509_9FABA|nr:hypothetical protein [Stylosanthes scabra]